MPVHRNGWSAFFLILTFSTLTATFGQKRSEVHDNYAAEMWALTHARNSAYTSWTAATEVLDTEVGRIWVFRPASPDLADFEASGEPAKQVVRPGAGPLGMTVKGADAETVNAYLRVCVR